MKDQMKKILLQFTVALTIVAAGILITYALNFDICRTGFPIGWLSCMGFYFSGDIFDDWHENKKSTY